MTRRLWIKTRYFTRVATRAICAACENAFSYTKTSRPRKYCRKCARTAHLAQMRTHNAEYRRLHRIRLGAS